MSRGHLNERHINDAAGDLRGEPLLDPDTGEPQISPKTGRFFDHATDVQQGLNRLKNAADSLKKKIEHEVNYPKKRPSAAIISRARDVLSEIEAKRAEVRARLPGLDKWRGWKE